MFDLDDTLAPEREFLRSGFRAVRRVLCPLASEEFAARAEAAMNEAADRHANHYTALEEMLDSARLRDRVNIKDVVNLCRNHQPDSGYMLRPDAEFLLAALRSAGIVCCLITDGRSRTQRNKIRALGLERFIMMGDMLISGETGYDKHHAYAFERVMSLYPNAQSYTYIGDNPEKDFIHPRRLGWHTIMIRDRGENISPQPLVIDKSSLAEEVFDDMGTIFWKNVISG